MPFQSVLSQFIQKFITLRVKVKGKESLFEEGFGHYGAVLKTLKGIGCK